MLVNSWREKQFCSFLRAELVRDGDFLDWQPNPLTVDETNEAKGVGVSYGSSSGEREPSIGSM